MYAKLRQKKTGKLSRQRELLSRMPSSAFKDQVVFAVCHQRAVKLFNSLNTRDVDLISKCFLDDQTFQCSIFAREMFIIGVFFCFFLISKSQITNKCYTF